MLYNGFTEFPHGESSLGNQIKEAFKILKIDIFKLNNRSSVKVVGWEEFSDSDQYKERKSFEKKKNKKKNNTKDNILSSIDEALELEEVSPVTPVRTALAQTMVGEQRKPTQDIVVLNPNPRPASSRKRTISPALYTCRYLSTYHMYDIYSNSLALDCYKLLVLQIND